MLKGLIDRIVDLGHAEEIKIDGRDYTTKPIYPVRKEKPETIIFHTLQGLVDYYLKQSKADWPGKLFFCVDSPTKVSIKTCLDSKFRQREKLAQAQAPQEDMSFLNRYHTLEDFIIGVQTFFAPTDHRCQLLANVGNIVAQAGVDIDDDGVTQKVTVKTGIHRKAKNKLPNPIPLTKYKTFPEIEQPEQGHVLRIRQVGDSSVEAGLFTIENSLWEVDTCNKIKDFLTAAISESATIIA